MENYKFWQFHPWQEEATTIKAAGKGMVQDHDIRQWLHRVWELHKVVGSVPVRSFLWVIFIGAILSFCSFNCCPFGFFICQFLRLEFEFSGKWITGRIGDSSSQSSFSHPRFGVIIFLTSWTKFSFKQIGNWIFTVMLVTFLLSYGSGVASGLKFWASFPCGTILWFGYWWMFFACW